MVDKIRAAGGEVYAVTSEPQRLATLAKNDWELNFETVGDPHHEISGACQDRGWLELIVNTEVGITALQADSIYSHPKGYFQPGVLALNSSGRVLYRWRGVPTRKNMGGATERPTAEHVFENLSRALENPTTTDAEPDLKPKLDSRGIPWPLFMTLLLANGWFIKPRPFPYIQGGPSVNTRAKRALMRMPFFFGSLMLAFALLPTGWVGVALLAYGLWLTPHFRYIGSQFQNVKE